MLNFTTLASQLKYGIIASILLIANALSAQTYDANLSLLKFNSSSAKVGNGQSVNDIVVFSNVITIGGQSIDAIIKTLGVTNVTTFDNYDYNTSDADFFAPRLTWGTGGGSFKFNITFIKNGTYNTTTKTGTAVNLINVVMNTYDIDGNGTSGTNQFNEFGDLKRYELGNPTNIVATYNSTTGLTKFRSKIDQNSGTTTADSQRVRVYFDTISSLDFMVGAEGKGLAYYYLDFSVGPTFTTACNLALSTDNATNPSCAGTSTGSISLTTSGGTTPYTYSWSGPSNTKTTEDATGIPAGSHTIMVTDKNSCKQVKTITLTDPTAPTITGSAAVCIGSDITLTGSGTANTSSPWTSSSTSTATVSSSGVVTGVAAGSTTITYKNSAGCTTTKSITVNASPTAAVSPTTATVNFKTAQSITATPSTGVTYAWTPSTGLSSTTTASVTATAAVDTRYLVTVTSTTNGCTDTASCLIKINIFDLATSCPTITKKNNGTTKGSKYVWGYRAKTTAYSVASGSLEMQFPNGTPATNIPFVKAIYTNGVLDNSVDFDYPMVDMTNGYDSTFPSNAKVYYNFYSSSKSGNLGNGNIVTIEFTDSFAATRAGRKEQTRMCAYDLSGGTPAVIPTPTITTNLAASYSDCKGANRTLSIKASLGTSGNTLSYQWYKNNVLMTSRTKDTLILANVQTTYSGDYHCIVKETNTSSVVVASVKSNITTYTVSAPIVTVSPTTATINVGSSQSLTASGASTYAWTPSTGLSATTGTTVTASPTVTTTYTVTGTAVSGCTNTATAIITVNTPLTGGKIAGSQSVCSGGDPTAFTSTTAASGGTGSITYQWQQSTNSGATFTDISTANSATYDVAAGITATTLYRRKATDAASTIKYSDTVTIAVNALPTITGTTNACIGASTTLTGSGTAATSNAWVSASTGVATISTSGVVTGVSAGTSVITYTNSNGCSKTETITINALPTISGSAEVCVGATSTLTGSGTAATTTPWATSNSAVASITSSGVMTGASAGTATITYNNSNGCSITANAVVNSLPTITGSTSVCQYATLSLTGSGTAASSSPWSSSNTSVAKVSNTGTVTGISGGTTTISYTNNKGCTETQIITVNGQPSVSVSPSSATISHGGSQSLTASGGSSYSWSPSATLSSSTGSSVTATPSTTTTYDVIGTDSKGCADTAQVTVTVLSSLSAGTIAGSQTICFGADPIAFTSSAAPSGGTGSLTTQWQKSINAGSTWSDISGATSSTYDESSSIAVTTSYRRKVTDGASNIDYSNTITITINSKPNASLSASQVSCYGGSNGAITTTLTGGTSPFTYSWSGSSYSATTKDISSLSAGSYTLICTDNNGCKDTASVSVTEPAAALSIGTPAVTAVGCKGASTGAINLTISGGTTAYSYAWTGPSSYTASTEDISSLAAGTYSVTVTDANGCTATNASVSVTEPSAALSLSNSAQTNVLCYGNSTGAVTVAAAGGTSPYEYKIGSGTYGSSATFSSLTAGSYTITAKDANGCTQTLSVTITEPSAALSIGTPTVTAVGCKGASTGAVNLTISGGTTAYSYAWTGPSSFTASTKDISTLAAGTYSVTVTDANGCTATNASVSVTEPAAALSLSNSAQTNVLCYGNSTGAVTVAAAGGTSPYEYKIGSGSYGSSATFSSLAAGSYTITAKDANGCTQTLSVTITQPAAAISVSAITSTNISCNGGNDGTITITATGGTTLKYSIDNGSTFQSSNVFSGLSAGNYNVVVSDNNSCSATLASGVSASVTLTQPNAISVSAITSTNISCNGGNDGTITITATGGTTLKYSINNGSTFQSSNVFSGLSAGNYTVVVSDNNSCSATLASGVSASVTLTQPNAISVSAITSTDPTCISAKDGTITITATGGNTLSYSIDNGTTFQSSNVFTGLGVGTYTINLSDSKLCLVSYGSVNTTVVLSNGDITKPVVSTKNYSAYLNAAGNITISYLNVDNGSYDNCEIKSIYLDDSTFDCTNLGGNTVTLTVTDIAGNTNSNTATVTVYDTISPTPKAKNLVVYLDATGNVSITAAQANNGSTDNCSIKTLSLSKSNFSCADTGVNNSIKFTATDYSNRTAYTYFNVRVYDTISPTPKAKNLVVYLDATGNVSITAAQANNGSTDNCSVKTLALSKSNFSCADTGVNNSVKFTATDYSNRTAYTFFNVRVYDTISPTPKAKNLVVYLDATGNVSITAAQANNGSTDNCSIKTLSLSKSNFSCADTGVNNSIKFTATDYSNRTAYTYFNVRVYDTISPTPKAKNLVVYLDATGNVSITAAQANNGSTDNCSIKTLSLSKSNFSCADTGVNNSIKFTATDYSNRTAYTFFNVRVYDTISPTPKAKNLVVYLDATGNVSITAAQANNGSTDNCSIKTLSLSKSNFSCADTGVNNSVKFTATDYSNRTAYTFFNVRVYDTISPTPKAKNLVVYLDATGNVSITAAQANNGSTDNCSIKTLSLSKSNFSCADTGVNNSIKFTATDYSNNTAYTYFNVRIYDTISPIPRMPDFVVYLNAMGTADIVNPALGYDRSTDNCATKSWTISRKTLTCADTGIDNAVKLTIKDRSDNTAYTYFNVRVYDTISPTPKAKNLVVYLDATGNVSITAAQADNGSTDNCSIKSLSISRSNFTCTDTGTHKGIVFTAVDYSNNTAYTTFDVTVLDTIKPTITVKTAVVYLDTAAKANLTKAMFTVSTNDNCGVIDTTISRYFVTLADTGWLDIDVWVKDKNNNVTGPVKTKVLVLIADSDNDSIPDYIEGSKDFDGDGVFDYADLDSDNDGILDVVENEAKDSLLDLDSDGQPNFRDLDTDNDGIDDIIEVDGSDSDFDGVAGNGKPTVDANGVPTIANGGYKEVFTDADLLPDYKDLDTDDDGIIDNTEKGAGKNPVDTDGDGKGDWRDLDTDNDGISDKTETDIDTDGDGTGDWRDLDTDNDGISDKIETDVDTDGDGKGDWRDLDSDNDGISDKIETDIDTDGDGTGDWRDLDTDNDGISDKTETDIDTDGDGTGDWRDLDTDNDGISDKIETDVDTDGDGKGDWRDLDSDNDGISDKIETDIDTDGDGTGDWRDLDTDNDGISDKIETDGDTDGDGKGDWRDLDSDNDQIPDKIETDIDTDGDGKGDWRDLDSDNDTIPDTKEAGDDPNNPTDTDGDGNADFRELDSDNDELPDELEGLKDSKTPNIWIPEGISPNGDGINDLLYIKGLANFKNASVLIFNRWGQIVYESGPGYNNLNGFDGYYHGKGLAIATDQPLPENVYFLVFKSNDDKGLIIKQNLYIKAN